MKPVKSRKSHRGADTGRLRIGDQWNAIRIIARSQTNPLKAVCELVENAIDARAGCIRIVRRRNKGRIFLDLQDDGQGVLRTEEGLPDFDRIATHICDSLKRYLDKDERVGVHGEFGIGLLSFWNLGEQLQIVSSGSEGRLYEMTLVRGQQAYKVRPMRGRLNLGGTRITVGPLLDATRHLVTGEKVQRYLSAELRDRIRTTGVQVRILDRIARRDLQVSPRQFEGEPLSEVGHVRTELGELKVELYLHAAGDGSRLGVAVCKDGTRVLPDITQLPAFERAPWSDGRLEGVIDFAALELAPGTRGGIVPDETYAIFVRAAESLEPAIQAAIDRYEQVEADRASQQILRQVQRAFVRALQELPPSEYLFFDLPQPRHGLGHRAGLEAGSQGPADGVVLPSQADLEQPDEVPPAPVTPLVFEPGPLDAVRIHPRRSRRRPGESVELTATAFDEHGQRIERDVEFQWQTVEGQATLEPCGDGVCRLQSDTAGAVVVLVIARQGQLTAEDRVVVKYVEGGDEAAGDAAKGLPTYRLEPEPGQKRRSRYDATGNEIVINSAHRDFQASRGTTSKHRRYIGKLYAKEVVLINFPHESPGEVMERLIEVLVRTEDAL